MGILELAILFSKIHDSLHFYTYCYADVVIFLAFIDCWAKGRSGEGVGGVRR
jgi:hypothetical protein